MIRTLAYGFSPPHAYRLSHFDVQRIWEFEWWNWSADETLVHYWKHQALVDELARAAGLDRPACLDELERERERERQVRCRNSSEPP